MSMEGSVARRTRPNPDRLPEDHFIDWLAEAQQLYRHELPPFVEKNQGSCRAGIRKNVTLRVTDDQQHGLPVEAEMTCWSWSPHYTFCTIDIGGRRLIVKGNSSDRYCSYKSWLGPEKGFSYQPVAFGPWQIYSEDSGAPNFDLRTQQPNHVQTLSRTRCLEPSMNSDTRAQHTSMKNQYTPRSAWRPINLSPTHPLNSSWARSASMSPEHIARQQYVQEQPRCIDTGSAAQAASPSIEDSPRPTQAKSHDVFVELATAHNDNQRKVRTPIERAPSSEPRSDVPSPKEREEHSPNYPCESERVSPSRGLSKVCPETQEDKDVASKPIEDSATGTRRQDDIPAEPNRERMSSRPASRNSVDTRTAHEPQSHGKDSTEPNSLTRPTKRRRQNPIPTPLNSTSPQLFPAKQSPSTPSSRPPPTPSTSSQQNSRLSTPISSNPQSTDSSSVLASHKQSRTTLFIAIPLSTDTVPLKLRSCMTIPSLFNSVLAICAQPGQTSQDIVSGIRATFNWKQERDVDRAILLKQDFPDTFEVFLEIIDGAPCWKEEAGRCGVGVEVVLA